MEHRRDQNSTAHGKERGASAPEEPRDTFGQIKEWRAKKAEQNSRRPKVQNIHD